jgi:photosystem II stability/assembly factor-like uncharacterized protein
MINKSLFFSRICAVTIAISISFGSTIFFSSAFSDKGAQWISVNHMLPEHLLVHDIALFGANEETIILASDAGAYVSEDGAMSWTNASKGLQHPEVQCLAVDHTGTHIFGGTRRNGAIKYLPATGNWVRYSTNLPARSIHALKTTSEFLYAGTNYEGLFRVKIGSERWSDLTFDDKNTILKDCFIQDLAIINDDRIFLATDKGILFTEDAGISWKYHTDNALRLKQFTCIEYHPLHKLLIAGTDGKGLVFSKDFGKSWLTASLNHPDIAQAYIKAISFHPEFADFWYIASDREGVFSSEDGGKTWLSINKGLSNTRIQSMITLRSDTFSLLAGTVGSGVFKYLSAFPPQAPSWNYTIGQENVQISWKASEEGSFPIAGYAIYRSKDVTPMQWEELIRLGASTRTWIDEKVAWGDIWLYSIRAFDNQEKPLFSSFADIKRIVVDDPPTLILQHPPEGFETEEESIVVQGIVSDQGSGVKSLMLFHKPSQGQAQEQALSWNSEGKFETQLKLSLGAQELILRAEDQQGNTTEVKRQILRKEPFIDKDPPTLILQHPPEGFETEEESIVVQGIVSDQGSGVKSLMLFHKPSQGQAQEQALSWNSEGKFETQLKLSLGAQELILRAEDQQGNTTEVKRQILRKELVKELIIKLRIGSKTARIGGRETLLPVAPQIFRGRTMVPLRFLAEAFGAKVQWLSSRQEIQITYREKFITLWLNQTRVLIEDLLDSSKPPIQKQLDVYPYLNQGTTMIPIRFISDEFGARVDWKADIQEITIHWIP